VLTIFVGGGKKAARKKPAWTKASQAVSKTRDVTTGIVTSRETRRESSMLNSYLLNARQNDINKVYHAKTPAKQIRNPNIEIRNKLTVK